MSRHLKKLIFFIFITHLFCLGGFAQTRNKQSTQELFAELREDEKLVAECERKVREYQITNYGRVLPKISGHCFDVCPIRLVLPYYPNEAKRLRISGQVKVEAIVDETGKVIYARAISGQPFLRQAAEQAARVSSYQPKKTCDDKPIKFRRTIIHNFILN
jgi:TonB family protein